MPKPPPHTAASGWRAAAGFQHVLVEHARAVMGISDGVDSAYGRAGTAGGRRGAPPIRGPRLRLVDTLDTDRNAVA